MIACLVCNADIDYTMLLWESLFRVDWRSLLPHWESHPLARVVFFIYYPPVFSDTEQIHDGTCTQLVSNFLAEAFEQFAVNSKLQKWKF
jgi:hypothetical protein